MKEKLKAFSRIYSERLQNQKAMPWPPLKQACSAAHWYDSRTLRTVLRESVSRLGWC